MTRATPGMKAARRARQAAARALHLLGLGLDAATLALFSDDWLDALTASYYEGAASYTLDRYNHEGFFDWERDAVERHFPAGGTVLVTSAGGGREALALLERGHRVVATECVETLFRVLRDNLAQAAARGAHAPRGARAPRGAPPAPSTTPNAGSPGNALALLLAPDAVPAEHGPFDAAVVGWTAYTHLTGRERRIAFLRRLRPALRPGAPVLVSYWGRVASLERGARAIAAAANLLRRPLARRLVEVGETTRNGHLQRHCAPGEVPAEARAAGFEVVEETSEAEPHSVLRRSGNVMEPAQSSGIPR